MRGYNHWMLMQTFHFNGSGRLWLLSALLLLIGQPASGQDAERQAAGRWYEMAYGVSLTPPPGTVQYEGPRVVWDDPRGFSIGFEIVYSEVPVKLEDFATSAMVQVGFARNTPRLMAEAGEDTPSKPLPETIAERPGIKLFFEIDPEAADQEVMIHGQAIIMLEPYAAAVVKLDAAESRLGPAREAFDAVLASLEIPLASELNDMREARVEAADAWLVATGPQALHAALPDVAWYRLTFDGKDIGHLRLASTREPETLRRRGYSPPGTFTLINRRQMINGQALDTQTTIFVSADGKQEEWSTKTTLRDPGRRRAGLAGNDTPALATWVETGVRGDRLAGDREVHAVTVISDSPPPIDAVLQIEKHERFTGKPRPEKVRGKTQVNEWLAPERAYLSQADLWVFPGLLPREPAEYCFTAYHPRTGKPGLRLVQVVPQDHGGVVVRDRPNSKLSPIEHVYDGEGKLLRRDYPDGMSLIPTSPQELGEIWDIEIR